MLGCGRRFVGEIDRFAHGVASADPRPDRLLLWTRLSGAVGDETLRLIVARDEELLDRVSIQEVVARASDGHVVHATVDGLSPGETLFYAFEAGPERSEIGRARTAALAPEAVRFVTTSCASYAHGYFHTYARIAEEPELDAVLHLGDYIYEYANGEYGNRRSYDPPHRVVSFADYRRRYAHYRRDPDLQALHASHPLIVTWDDHEFSNDAWAHGSPDHDASVHGPWPARREAARTAHREWLPRTDTRDGELFRKLSFGGLVDCFVLDTRMERESPPLREPGAGASILGQRQREWLLEGVRASTATWKVIAQSVQLSPHPEFWNFDAWDGYAHDRRTVLETIARERITGVVFLCGDGHKSFADDLPLDPFRGYDPSTGAGSLAVELMAPAASSSNLFGAEARAFETLVRMHSPHTKWIEAESRGYWRAEFRATKAIFQLVFVDGIERVDGGSTRRGPRFEVRLGEPHLVRID